MAASCWSGESSIDGEAVARVEDGSGAREATKAFAEAARSAQLRKRSI